MCSYFNRSGFYDFIKRKNSINKDTKLINLIKECHSIRFQKVYGCRRVFLWINNKKGIYYNYKTVWRVMNKYGLSSKIRRRGYKNYTNKIYKYPNIMNRNFIAKEKNQKWVIDISYIIMSSGTLYLSIIRGLFDNHIVSYKTSAFQSNKLVYDTVLSALKEENISNKLLLHSGGEYQYASLGYHDIAQRNNITLSMSRVENPYGNSPAENFFSIIKIECLRIEKPENFSKANQLIDKFIYFYNYNRIQLKKELASVILIYSAIGGLFLCLFNLKLCIKWWF